VNDGVEETYTTLGLGAVFGEIGVMKSEVRSASAMAVGEASLLAFPGDKFTAIVEESPAISRIVLKTMFSRFQKDVKRAERRKALPTGGHLYPVFSGTGGAGTSLTVANLAFFVKDLTKKRVLVLDLDLMFGDQGAIHGITKSMTLADIVMQEAIEQDDVQQLVQSTPSGVDVLVAPSQPEQAEFLSSEFISICLDHLENCYDYIFVDTSTVIGDLCLDLFDRATVPIYLVTPEITSIQNAVRWIDLVQRIGLSTEGLKVLTNKVEPGDGTSLAFVQKHFGDRLLGELPFEAGSAKACLNSGQSIQAIDPLGDLCRALNRTAGKLLGVEIDSTQENKVPFWKKWL
jgi:MinD-like ATPase involved in chromosome partitioning or flagellar assembly